MLQDEITTQLVSRNKLIGTLEVVFGSIFTAFMGFLLFGCLISMDFPGIFEFFIWSLLFFGLSLYALICGSHRLKLGSKFNRYIGLLEQKQVHDIEQLAAVVNVPLDIMKNDLALIIKKGFIRDAYIEDKKNKLICGPHSPHQEQEPNVKMTVTCKNCGAKNIIDSEAYAICEYCRLGIDIEENEF